MSQVYARRNKETHTANRTPRPVFIASTGGKYYRIGVRDVGHPISGSYHAAEGGSGGHPGKSQYDTVEKLDNFIASSEFTEGPCLLLEKGSDGVD
jgi:hypothetical protein